MNPTEQSSPQPRESPATLARERDLLQAVMNGAKNAHLVYLDRDFNFVRVNETYAATCGYRPEEMIGKNHFALYPHAENEAIFRRVRDTGEPVEFHDKPFVFPDQPYRGVTYWDWTLTPVKDMTGEVEGLVFALQETTTRQRAEDALRASEERLRAVLDATGVGLWLNKMPFGDLTWDARTRKLFFVGPEEQPTIDVFWSRVHPDDREPTRLAVEAALRDRTLYAIDHRAVDPATGQVRWIHSEGRGIYDQAGTLVRFDGVNYDITARKQAEQELERTRNQLAEGQRIAHLGSWEFIAATHETVWSEEVFRIFGLAPASRSPAYEEHLKLIHPDDAPEVDRSFRAALQHGAPFENENRIIRPDGEVRWVYNKAQAYRDEHGQLLRYVGVVLDITERKRAEESLRQSEERLRLAQASANVGIWDWQLDTGQLDWTQELERMYGYEPGTFPSNYAGFRDRVHPDDIVEVECRRDAAVAAHEPFEFDFRVRRPSGEIRWINCKGAAHYDVAGRPQRVFGVNVDITERKRAEQALRESELRYRAIGESIDYGVWVCAPDGRNIYASSSFLKLVGLTQEQCSNFGWGAVLHPDDAERTIAAWKECVRTGGNWDIEHRFRGVDGQWHPILARGVPVRDEAGRILCWAGINLDISRLKQTEVALAGARDELERKVRERTAALEKTMSLVELERKRFQQVLDQLPAYLILLTPDHRVRFENRFFRERFGELRDRRCYEHLFGRSAPCEPCASAAVLDTGQPCHWESTGPDGRRYEIHSFPFTETDGSPLVLEVGLDITERWTAEMERQKLRDELTRASRISTAGQLAASLAHEVNQPLGAIALNVEAVKNLLDQGSPEDPDLRAALRDIETNSRRAGAVIHQLRRLYQKTGQEHAAIQINDLVEKTAELLHSELVLKQVAFGLDLDPELPLAWGNAVELQQVVLNLLTNAVDAMVTREAGSRRLLVRTGRENPTTIRVSVCDSGPGLADEQLRRIFEPFYSTKTSGMGMGLAICQSIVESHHGRLWAENKAEGGAVFHFTVPASASPRV